MPIPHPVAFMGAAAEGVGGDSFPVWETADDTSGQGTGQNFTAVYPANSQVGDLILLFVATTSNSEVTQPSTPPNEFSSLGGWTANFQRIRAYWHRYDGDEDANFTVVMSASQYRAWRLIRVSGAHTSSPPESVDGNTGISNSPNPLGITPSWGSEKNLYLAIGSFDGAVTITSYPTDYVNGTTNGTTERLAVASRAIENGSENPGAFTLSGPAAWVVDTIAIRPAA